ncbi:MAG: WYL domain-containing transcriptional regulator [Clostridiales bacterium]|nr:WYL domain-containing transcriptional regulator [Candidatus Equinaster intestinalis]
MARSENQKLKLLRLVEILNLYTDEDHTLTADELCSKLADYDISAERKAIYGDIEALNSMGYDILNSRSGKRGYFMASRKFEMPEIYLLCDAVRSADFITPKKTRELCSKLDDMISVYQKKERDKGIYIDGVRKCKNEEIYYNIDVINQAIISGKKITFKYCNHILEEGKKIVIREKAMKISPYAMLWENDHYYLVGNNEKYDNLIHLRLDRMKKVEKTDENYRHFRQVSRYTDAFDIVDYTAKAFNMFGGELRRIELKCKKEKLEQIIDRFSDNIMIYGVTEETFNFSTEAMLSDGLIGWILQFGGDVEAINPPELVEEIKIKLKSLTELYGK